MRKNTTTLVGFFIAFLFISLGNNKTLACTECGITSIGTISGPSSICAKDTAVYTFSGTTCLYSGCTLERITYVYCGSTLIYQSSVNTTSSQKIVIQNAGSYSVYAKVRAKGYSYWCKTNTIYLTVKALPDAPTSSCTTLSKCVNQSFTLSATPACSTIIKWYKGSSYLGSGNSISLSETTAGTYTYKAYSYNSYTGCTSSSYLTFTATVVAGPSSLVISAPSSAFIGEAISISGSSSGTGNTYSWNFGDASSPSTGTGAGPVSVTYSTIGPKTITMTVTNSTGCKSTLTQTIIICPKAVISGPSSACKNTYISFSATPMDSNTFYTWNFGSGASPATATGAGPFSVKYTTTGTKTVTLTVTDSIQSVCTSTATKTVAINGVENLVITAPTTALIGEAVSISGSANGTGNTFSWSFGTSSSPSTGTGEGPFNVSYSTIGNKYVKMTVSNGTCSSYITKKIVVCSKAIINGSESACENTDMSFSATDMGTSAIYNWNFGTDATPSTATGKGPHNVTYSSSGTKTVSLTVTDCTLTTCTNTATKTITIYGASNVVINSANSVIKGDTLTVTGSASGTNITYSWDFGSNATPSTATGSGPIKVVYSSIGSQEIKLTVSSGTGCSTVVTKNVDVCPKAIISCPQSTCSNNSISFSATDMGTSALYSWNFGSGATPATATGKGPHSVTYSAIGSKTVSLTVTDNTLTLCTSTATKTVQINGVQNPVINSASSVVYGDSLAVSSSATGSGLTYSWNFGTGASPATATGAGPIKVYFSSKGTKTISLTITDGSSCTVTLTKDINVCDGYKINAPATACSNTQVSISATKVGSDNSTCGDTICWVSPTKSYVSAKTYWSETSENVTIRTIFSKEFVDNTYGTNKIGWPGSHNFSDLTGSDKLQLALYDNNGAKSLEFKIDYLSASTSVSSGYKTLGVSGGDGGMLVGSSSNIVSCLTSLDVNFNQYGYVLTSNSPATDANYTPNSSYPNWIYEVWYEVTVKKSAFGTAGFGYPTIASVHASPSKTGNNTEVVEKTACPQSLAWNFGSGATPSTATGIGPHNVTYSSTETKTITLTSGGCSQGSCSNVFTKTIEIIGLNTPIITAASNVVNSDTISFTGSGTGTDLTFAWNFGSGATPATATGAGPHKVVYSTSGNKTVSLTATNSANCSATATKEITVCDGYKINSDATTCTNKTVSISATKVGNSTTSCGDTICWVSPTKSYVTAKTYWSETSENVTIRTIFSKEFVDNTYGTNKIGWPGSHNFSDLTGSDKLQLALYDNNGAKSLEFKIDYLSASTSVSSGYKTLGVSGGDGGMLVGSSSNIVSCLTSLDVNFNQYGYVLTSNSPATDANYTPNSSYPNWIYEVWYEVTVKKSAFGTAGFGYPTIASVHASPSKTGNNTEVVEKTACPQSLAWNFGSGATPSTATGIGPHNVTYSSTGTKTITLTSGGCSQGSCSNVFTKAIEVSNGPCAEINAPNFKIFMDTAFTYSATAIQGATYSWSATGNATITGTGSTVTILFGAAGSQTITLITTLNGCSCTTTKAVTVYEPICNAVKFDYTTLPLKTNLKNYLYIDVTGNTVKLYKPTYQYDSFHTSRKFQRSGDTAISWQELTSTTSKASIKFNRSASDLTFTVRDLDLPQTYNNEMMELRAYLNGDLIPSNKIQATYNSNNISKIADNGFVVKYKGLNVRNNAYNNNDLKFYFTSKVDSVFLTLSNVNGNNCGYKSDVGISEIGFCITEPLPVTWLKVKAVKNSKGGANITWATAAEINNDYFTIEKSVDKVNFEAIGKVNGSGNTSVITNYSFEDKNIGSTTTYYRIKQTDYNGKFEYSIIVAVTPDNVIDNVKVNPNPASNWATLDWSSGMRNDITIQVTNLVGVVVYDQTVPAELNSYIMNLENIQNGFYIVNIIHNNTIISKSKLIVKKS